MPASNLMTDNPTMSVVAVNRSEHHSFSKAPQECIVIRTGLGVDRDAHQGATVKHRSRVARDPDQPNLRQVHLIHEELFTELAQRGFVVGPGNMGENITTRGVALLDLPRGTRLVLGQSAVIELTGLRNPCAQLDAFQPGLMKAVLDRTADGRLVRKSGVMANVVADGEVRAGDLIRIEMPNPPYESLDIV